MSATRRRKAPLQLRKSETLEPRRAHARPVDAEIPESTFVREEHDVEFAGSRLFHQFEQQFERDQDITRSKSPGREGHALAHHAAELCDPSHRAIG